MLPRSLRLDTEFDGKEKGKHPVVLLFSLAKPERAHLMPIFYDMSYDEFAAFIPYVHYRKKKKSFIYSKILYLNSGIAIFMGRFYKFPKFSAKIVNKDTRVSGFYGAWRDRKKLLHLKYKFVEGDTVNETRFLDRAFSLTLINGDDHFKCAQMDWVFPRKKKPQPIKGTILLKSGWLGEDDNHRLQVENARGVKMQIIWHLSVPSSCF